VIQKGNIGVTETVMPAQPAELRAGLVAQLRGLGAVRSEAVERAVLAVLRHSPESAILRELALSESSLSAQQLAELLDDSVRPSVPKLREYLRAHDRTLVFQVRRGGFALGAFYKLRTSTEETQG